MCITNKEVTKKVISRAEAGGWECFHACLRGCLFILGVDSIIEKVTFERRHEVIRGALGEEVRARGPGEGVCLECLRNSEETLRLDQREPGEESGREGSPHVGLWVLLYAFTLLWGLDG